ncbi:P-loop containing nucleoside triphosphate hydrolase protein [Aspergillus campestris IBT 28561]|uniref:P-loop containing nucleoside triphosphate hydrolase protein n=1 Tax=Aspergillus campestris (strain IBT 28561) TaxID=1392248 RepID=A0A2I1D6R1_ASPC2|nr:P-loop containing nucleoside triphosphate hydrolase protein [Aspergillus campestris IBT 28561]PKY05543.1 P-loop containing nucleoside triphosphate hydrolase protein [Aspergillus campestris IBT 28561]
MANLFSKPDTTVKFPVKSIRYHGLGESIAMAQPIAINPAISLLLSSSTVRLRQGLSINQGRSRSFWNVTFHISNIHIVSLETAKDELIYTFESRSDFASATDIEHREALPEPSTYPLAAVNLLNRVIQITMGLPSPKLWERQSGLVCQALRGGSLVLSQAESEYVNINSRAIIKEAEEEEKCLAGRGCHVKCVSVAGRTILGIWPGEDRPFRLYRGCTVVLRGKHFFVKEVAKCYRISGEKESPEEWMASVSGDSPKWRSLLDAPVHAVLKNEVDIRIFGHIEVDNVEVHPLSNPVVQNRLLGPTRKLSENWGDEDFDTMCQEFENHGATIPSGHTTKLPLTSMFLLSAPRVDTHDPLITSPGDLSTLVPKEWRLNEAQAQATTQLLTHSFSLVAGPPGTGKTRIIAAAAMFVTQFLRHSSVGSARLAVLVPTDAAGAAVMSQLSSAFQEFRYGDHKLMRLRSRADSEDRLFGGDTQQFDDIEQIIAHAKEKPGKYGQFLREIERLRTCGRVKENFQEFNQQRRELIMSVMKDVQVVVTLPLNTKEMIRREFSPEFVIFDEANYFRDPEIFSVLGQLKADSRVLFVGDPKQLSPPVFTSQGATAWTKSAFTRLLDKKYHQTLLNLSYRSHKILYNPTSIAYYEGQAQSFRGGPNKTVGVNPGNPVIVRLGSKTWSLPGLSHFLHLARINLDDTNKDPSGSLFHPREAELGVELARSLLDRGARDILIISPYKAQVALVKKVWEQNHPHTIAPRIQTVDASQGSEAEVVIVLITRNFGSAGCLQSTRRTNVMLSRARVAQYVVGNWDWVAGRGFAPDSGKLNAYFDGADHVLDKRTDYAIAPTVG